MKIGVPTEVKVQEFRVGLTPANVLELTDRGHEVFIQNGAGAGIGLADSHYEASGARILPTAKDVFDTADMIVKVKEPQREERAMLRDGQILFTYLHLAPDPEQTADLVKSGAICIAYETVTSPNGGLPLLAPMSEVAGRLSVQAGAYYLEKPHGGHGVLLGGVPGVDPAKVVVIGGGVVGRHAVHIALGMGADVWVLDRNVDVLKEIWAQFGRGLNTVYSTRDAVERHCMKADLVICGVLIPGAAAPKLISAELIKKMKPGSVVVDVAIDQGGCMETSRPTTHDDPVFVVDDVVHYCVANMPGAVPKTSTVALNNATLPFTMALADKGYKQALLDDEDLRAGLNVHKGRVTHPAVAEDLDYEYLDPMEALSS